MKRKRRGVGELYNHEVLICDESMMRTGQRH